MKKQFKHASPPLLAGPRLESVRVNFQGQINTGIFPFSLPIIKNLREIKFPTQVTFFVGENGTGKSTILEAIAHHAGFGAEGGSKNISFKTSDDQVYSGVQQLANQFTLSWKQKPKDGYFF